MNRETNVTRNALWLVLALVAVLGAVLLLVGDGGTTDTDLHAFGGSDAVLYGASPAVGVFAALSADGGRSWQLLEVPEVESRPAHDPHGASVHWL